MRDGPPITSVHELVAMSLDGERRGQAVWFRGQPDASKGLDPKLWRRRVAADAEGVIMSTFQTFARSRAKDCPPAPDEAAWLSLMQHYGAPTRLLDWSRSVLVAAYFAVESCDASTDGALFCLRIDALNRIELGTPRLFSMNRGPSLISKYMLPGSRHVCRPDEYRVAAVIGDEIDARQAAQLSCFTLHTERCVDLATHPNSDDLIQRFVIPGGAKRALLEDLATLGISRMMLFPDLEGLGTHINRWFKAGQFDAP